MCALVSKSKTWIDGDTLNATDINQNFDTLYTLVNGNIDSTNIDESGGLTLSTLSVDTVSEKTAANGVTIDSLNIKDGAVTQEAWTAPAFEHSWVNYGTYQNAGYMKDKEGFVHLRGLIKSGTLAASAFTLPAGYRPAVVKIFGTISNGDTGRVDVDANGLVIPKTPSVNAWVSLEGITFDTRS